MFIATFFSSTVSTYVFVPKISKKYSANLGVSVAVVAITQFGAAVGNIGQQTLFLGSSLDWDAVVATLGMFGFQFCFTWWFFVPVLSLFFSLCDGVRRRTD